MHVKAAGMILEERIRWCLEAVSDTDKEWMIDIAPVSFIIGRDEECHLTLIDKWISRRHSEIRASGDHLWIRDLGSTNGTLVNNKVIAQAELLEHGDIIAIGRFKFRIKRAEASPNEAAETCSMSLSEQTSQFALLQPQLTELIRERNLFPHFQPVLSYSDMKVVGYEILSRVAGKGMSPNISELFEMAEWMGHAAELSTLCREVGVEIGRNLPGEPALFVNTCPSEIYEIDTLIASLKRLHRIAPMNRIVVEINEKAAAGTKEMARLRVGLHELNMGLAFDDFGAGQTRLVELAKVPPDFLKFDISLVRQIHLAPQRLRQMVGTFVKAAQDLGIATLAEGVECSDEAQTCRLLGFDYVQGFLYGKPLPFDEIYPGALQT
jgi:EAL domain-containing protein (putative c-di-GMP-specific phosphodiesterase class I)